MSAVRMCDRCGRIFPEGEEGSGIFGGSRMFKNERTGRMESVQTQMDVCGQCNTFPAPVQPRVIDAKAHDER